MRVCGGLCWLVWPDIRGPYHTAYATLCTGDPQLTRLGETLLPKLHVFFEGAGPIRPSVLHGDLWSGNIGQADGQPVIFGAWTRLQQCVI